MEELEFRLHNCHWGSLPSDKIRTEGDRDSQVRRYRRLLANLDQNRWGDMPERALELYEVLCQLKASTVGGFIRCRVEVG